ncbi:DUF29 domain-containing protein [Verrucomicrobium sp. 3C]|uniref:DUF29 domain-containing protein n=1 Tax=Verrucomicrobium sp. 3C TaxID=1134055 RepID=UPI0003733CE7|nr:DUF29 domain-containing protein [Verrucomicrobium sp. 3C]
MTTKELYERDLYAWTQETARLLRARRFSELDLKNLIEEVEDLGSSERHRLEGQLEALIEHLLYIGYLTTDPERDGHGWRYAVERARDKALRVLKKNPSFKHDLGEVIEDAYRSARESLLEKADIMKADRKICYSIRREELPPQCPWPDKELFEKERYFTRAEIERRELRQG